MSRNALPPPPGAVLPALSPTHTRLVDSWRGSQRRRSTTRWDSRTEGLVGLIARRLHPALSSLSSLLHRPLPITSLPPPLTARSRARTAHHQRCEPVLAICGRTAR